MRQEGSLAGNNGGLEIGQGADGAVFHELDAGHVAPAGVDGHEDGPPPPAGIAGLLLEDQLLVDQVGGDGGDGGRREAGQSSHVAPGPRVPSP